MIDYYNGQLTDIIPDSLKGDPVVQAMSFAISNMTKKIVDNAKKASVYAVIDSLGEEIVDLLAVELRAKYYGSWLSLEEKKAIVKKTLLWYSRAGTLFTTKELTDFVFEHAKIEEWFQYGGDAFLFRIIVTVISQDISMRTYLEFIKSLREVKNTRSHLEKVIFRYNTKADVRSAAAGMIGNTLKIKARVAQSIKAVSEDKSSAALLFENSVSVKASNEIKKSDVYVMSEDGEKIRVLTENGSMVRTEAGWK